MPKKTLDVNIFYQTREEKNHLEYFFAHLFILFFLRFQSWMFFYFNKRILPKSFLDKKNTFRRRKQFKQKEWLAEGGLQSSKYNKHNMLWHLLVSTIADNISRYISQGRVFQEVKEDDIYLKFGHLKIRTIVLGQTDRQTDWQTDRRRTDRQTLWFLGKLHFQKE